MRYHKIGVNFNLSPTPYFEVGGKTPNNVKNYFRLKNVPKRALQLLVVKKLRWGVIVKGLHVYKIHFLPGGYIKMKKIFCKNGNS